MKNNIILLKFFQNGESMLTNEKKIQIESIVRKIIMDVDFSESQTVDIVSLVKKDDFLVQSADLPIGTTGYLAVNDNSPVDESGKYHRLIVVNKKFKNPDNEDNVILKKSRFITAHEYGHFILHKPKNQPLYAHRDSDKRDDPQELEADYFARSILMPADNFLECNKIMDKLLANFRLLEKRDNGIGQNEAWSDIKLELLSKMFKVTKNKAKRRLEDIDVLSSIAG